MTFSKPEYDAVVVGAGPNGLAAAITLARTGLSVLVLEAKSTVGGGTRTQELTLPGFLHDVCSAIHPLGVGSPFFRSLPLEQYGLEWVYPSAALAHPLDDGSAILLERSIPVSGANLSEDAEAYTHMLRPLAENWDKLAESILGPLRLPRHPLPLARFGLQALRSARGLARANFKGERARAVFAGLAAHSFLPLEQPPSAAFGLVLGALVHATGWPFPRGGSQQIADALSGYLRDLGGEIVTDYPVETIKQIPPARAILFDITPKQLLRIAGDSLPSSYQQQLSRYRYGPGVFKLDYALDGPIPWRSNECLRAGTVHLGGTLEEIAAGERAVAQGRIPEKPFVLVTQQSLFDPTRAPTGKQTVWAYCHVPNGSTVDMTEIIERQIERFAPGFRELILARHKMNAVEMELYNSNYIGGDINGGIQDFFQLFTRPVARLVPYATPTRGLYICSSSTPPGGGVHGMCGYFAAQAALKTVFKK
ncbi:MAG TPA: NAD(P)/FAD-dependent oxidoreductase [Chloroflexia bacterium]|nr:NAD(P)/FAD-dependent oxidoreductase [Chloroflexia bacterium]